MKFGLFALMCLVAWFMYGHRAFVVDAYATSDSNVDIRLDGIDLDVETTPLPPSPFVGRRAADTRRRPLELAYVAPRVGDPEAIVSMEGGTSTLSGTATVNNRVVPGAQVYIERHTADGVGSITVPVDERGQWNAEELPGGRYRIRSWVPGRAVDPANPVFFLEAGKTHHHAFRLGEVDERVTVRVVDSGEMFDGLSGSVGVTVGRRQVDDQGRLVTDSVPGARVTLAVSGAARLESPPTVTVGPSGHVTFRLRCIRVGPVNVLASVEGPVEAPPVVAEDSDVRTVRPRPSGPVVRAAGSHPGCRAIPPPPPPPTTAPTTVPANDGSGEPTQAANGTAGGSGNQPRSTTSTPTRRAPATTRRAPATTVAPRATASTTSAGASSG